ncbi:MAG: hypothetical protein HDR88_15355 [Bacteroides sp.]|nr:hypothetical protein [Bacteroides sp.]
MTLSVIIWLIVAVALSGAMLVRIVDENKPVRQHLLHAIPHYRNRQV